MPTYEYICESCEHEFEQFQSITARPLRKCPQCGKATLKRLIGTGAGIIFKGNGFYETDYRSDSYSKDKTSAEKSTSSDKKTDSGTKSAAESGNKTKKSDTSAKKE